MTFYKVKAFFNSFKTSRVVQKISLPVSSRAHGQISHLSLARCRKERLFHSEFDFEHMLLSGVRFQR